MPSRQFEDEMKEERATTFVREEREKMKGKRGESESKRTFEM